MLLTMGVSRASGAASFVRATLTRRVIFSAAHRYRRPEWDDARNAAEFGVCASPNWHGHTYTVADVTIGGPVDPITGFCANLFAFDVVLKREVFQVLDHKNLVLDVPEFAEGKLIPSSENVAWWIARKVQARTRRRRTRVARARVRRAESLGRGRTGMSAAPDGTSRLDAVDEVPVWLEVNGEPAVTWMCTPENLPELVVGWCFGEGYIDAKSDLLSMRPCAKEPGFWVTVPEERYQTVEGQERRRVLASGCGAVTTILGSLSNVPRRTIAARCSRSHADARALSRSFSRAVSATRTPVAFTRRRLTDGTTLLNHAEDIGRHNAVDKVLGAQILAGKRPDDLILLVTGSHLRRARLQGGARAHCGGGHSECAEHDCGGDRAGGGNGVGWDARSRGTPQVWTP